MIEKKLRLLFSDPSHPTWLPNDFIRPSKFSTVKMPYLLEEELMGKQKAFITTRNTLFSDTK